MKIKNQSKKLILILHVNQKKTTLTSNLFFFRQFSNLKSILNLHHVPRKKKHDQNKTNAKTWIARTAQQNIMKNIAQTKTYKRALMTNNEVDTESLPLSPLKYVEHSRSSFHLYVDFARAHTSSVGSRRTHLKNVKQKKTKEKKNK